VEGSSVVVVGACSHVDEFAEPNGLTSVRYSCFFIERREEVAFLMREGSDQ
jgi:hypothetical protein